MRDKLTETIIAVCNDLYKTEPVVELERPDPQFGDFSTNVAMQLAKPLGKNPRDIAQTIVEKLQLNPLFSEVGVAGPGFINMILSDETLLAALHEQPTKSLVGLEVLVEYSDPNPFKPLHAGHLYTTLVGDVLARLVERAGAQTIRLNYGGDVGRHVGISMWAAMKTLGDQPMEALQQIPPADRPAWMGARYVEGTQAFEEDPTAKAEILETNKKVYQLHVDNDHDSDFAQVYWSLRETSYDFFKKLYADLQVVAFDRFIAESEVTPLGLSILEAQQQNGVFAESNGAIVFDGEQHGLHTRVFLNSEGLPTYETKELGLMQTKWDDYEFNESIIITATEQKQYMEVVLKAIEQFEPVIPERTKHITHGVVKLQGGQKMSSRKGNVLSAFDILDAARSAGGEDGKPVDEQTMLAAVKYAFLKNRIGGDIVYDAEESIATEGNSGPYLQYAHARARSILSKSEQSPTAPNNVERSERLLVRALSEYASVIEQATTQLAPHLICTYLYELAQTFNRFYEQTKVIGSDRESERLFMVQVYADTLKNGLNLLGIHAPEKM